MDFWQEIKKQQIESTLQLLQLLSDELFLQSEQGVALIHALETSFNDYVKK